MNPGYSGKPLAQKLGIQSGMAVGVVNAPAHYLELLGTLLDGVAFRPFEERALDVIHLFVTSQSTLAAHLPFLKTRIVPNGMIWVSWYKKSAKIPTDVTEDTIRDLALTIGLVDVKVCAVDDLWSGLKLVIRLKDR